MPQVLQGRANWTGTRKVLTEHKQCPSAAQRSDSVMHRLNAIVTCYICTILRHARKFQVLGL